jgi:uncharacterized protein with FMN-binding domain
MNYKILLVSGFVALLAGFFAFEKFSASPQNTVPAPIINNNPPPATTAGFKDGTYTGPVVNSMYGPAQARVIVSSGQIKDVQFLQYPNDRQASIMKSNMAMPIIKQEVIQSQSANVNTVSGATQTADSFIQSISSALSQAS